ncbi:AAA family ATPase [Methylomarinovum caldicuralii]|uniref:AAA family ATPase n=1 Tax=Methylomarinovum caldicuralii TaxID=438856 RepID=UPI002954EBBB|nr:AAA family ATPase [Methylomarinovum caldicuralii]
MAYLRYGLAQGEGFVIVTGMPGTGKTLLVKALLASLRQENIVAGVMVTSQVGAEDTLRIISATFGLAYDGDDKATLLRNLERFFKEKTREGKRVLLVVDEAQNLPLQSLEELRMLSNFEVNGRPLFQAFLLGQDEFRLALESDALTQVRQRVIATYHLRPLTLEETRAYILHRLKLAGWQQDPRFNEAAFEEIHSFTKGIPRVVNSLCDRLLLFAYLEERHDIDAQVVQTVVEEIREEAPAGESPPTTQEAGTADTPALTRIVNSASQGGLVEHLERRIEKLESRVAELQSLLQRERALLRKAILLQLDMDEVYAVDLAGPERKTPAKAENNPTEKGTVGGEA